MQIYKAPPVLFINLKRFKSSSGSYYKDKLEETVKFPLKDLDLSNKILSNVDNDGNPIDEIKYELYAISNHYGGMGFGHYTAYAKNPNENEWFDFDDSSVSKVTEDSVITDAAYNLFYLRTDLIDQDKIDFDKFKNDVNTEEFITMMDKIRKQEEAEDKQKATPEK